jgi:acyl carrier protein phosphodiesterase
VNFLFHLHLSGDDPEILTGNLMGDFVKGAIGDQYPPGVKTGLILHRRIDSFAQSHVLFRQSRQRIDPRYGHWRGVLVDMFYDHFLALEWSRWSPEPLDAFLARSCRVIEDNRRYLPERLLEILPVIFETLIPSYCTTEGVGRALERMGRRVRRSNPLAEGVAELSLHREGLREDFQAFMPEIQKFSNDYLYSEGWK